MNIIETTDNVTEIIDNNNTTLYNYTNNNNDDNNFLTIEISPWYLLLLTLPCGLSILCCLSLLSYGFIKMLINKK